MNIRPEDRRLTPDEKLQCLSLDCTADAGLHMFAAKSPEPMPKIVCLCGSTKFKEEFQEQNRQETIAGHIVLSVGTFAHREAQETARFAATIPGHPGVGLSPEEFLGRDVKQMLDDLHKRKIDLADEILVLNVDGYIGHSTASEIAYAYRTQKPVRWLSKVLTHQSFKLLCDEWMVDPSNFANDITEVA